jgi:hypothetical protein
MLTLKDRTDFTEGQGDTYDTCLICGPEKMRALIYFDSGSVAPTVGETVTGATTSDTGVIEHVTLISGTYAGGDATGAIVVTSPTGYNSDTLVIFEDDETLTGSTSGSNFATVNGNCGVTRSGRIYRTQDLIEYRGNKYCNSHFGFRFRRQWLDEADVNISESERNKT